MRLESPTVTGSGTIEPGRQPDLTFGTAGTVQTLSATVGEKVRTGERLATIDDRRRGDRRRDAAQPARPRSGPGGAGSDASDRQPLPGVRAGTQSPVTPTGAPEPAGLYSGTSATVSIIVSS
jgi:hypothetical protein